MSLIKNNKKEDSYLSAIKDGFFNSNPPYGYKRHRIYSEREVKTGKGRNPIFIDPEEADRVKEIFDLYATGEYNSSSLSEYLNNKYGPTFRKDKVIRIISNKFYAGFTLFKGNYYRHSYPPIISLELYEKIQEIRRDKNRPKRTLRAGRPDQRRKRYKKNSETPIPPFRLKSLMNGFWIAVYPLGYKTVILDRKDKFYKRGKVYIDEKESMMVKDVFELYSTGSYSISELTRRINDKHPDFNLARSSIHNILANKFYVGIMVVKGQHFPHNYPIFIAQEIFEKCQYILENNTKNCRTSVDNINHSKDANQLTDIEQQVCDCLSFPLDIEELSLRIDLPIKELNQLLSTLIDRNFITKNSYGEYEINKG